MSEYLTCSPLHGARRESRGEDVEESQLRDFLLLCSSEEQLFCWSVRESAEVLANKGKQQIQKLRNTKEKGEGGRDLGATEVSKASERYWGDY